MRCLCRCALAALATVATHSGAQLTYPDTPRKPVSDEYQGVQL